MYTACERIKAALTHNTLDRIPIFDSIWPEAVKRWQNEGLPADTSPEDYFGFDDMPGISPFGDDMPEAFPHVIYEETDDYVIDRNHYGVKVKYWKNKYATHVELEHAVEEKADWEKAKWALSASDKRLKENFVEQSKKARAKGGFVNIRCFEPHWFTFRMLGMQNMCIQMKLDPDFIQDICDTYMSFLMEMLRKTVEAGVEWDGIWFFSDMAYKNGPMYSPEDYKRFFLPCHRMVSDFCKSHGKYLLLHSDGRMEKLIPLLIEAGFDAVQPLEARASNDVRIYKDKFGDDICLFGNISSDVLATGNRDAIEEEIRSKVMKAKQGGGYIYHSDHTIPYTISFEDYKFAMECARKYGAYK